MLGFSLKSGGQGPAHSMLSGHNLIPILSTVPLEYLHILLEPLFHWSSRKHVHAYAGPANAITAIKITTSRLRISVSSLKMPII